MNRNSNKKVVFFIFLLIVMLIIPYYKIIQSKKMVENYVFVIMWIPAIAGILTKLIYDKNLKGMGFNLGKLKYIVSGYPFWNLFFDKKI